MPLLPPRYNRASRFFPLAICRISDQLALIAIKNYLCYGRTACPFLGPELAQLGEQRGRP